MSLISRKEYFVNIIIGLICGFGVISILIWYFLNIEPNPLWLGFAIIFLYISIWGFKVGLYDNFIKEIR